MPIDMANLVQNTTLGVSIAKVIVALVELKSIGQISEDSQRAFERAIEHIDDALAASDLNATNPTSYQLFEYRLFQTGLKIKLTREPSEKEVEEALQYCRGILQALVNRQEIGEQQIEDLITLLRAMSDSIHQRHQEILYHR